MKIFNKGTRNFFFFFVNFSLPFTYFWVLEIKIKHRKSKVILWYTYFHLIWKLFSEIHCKGAWSDASSSMKMTVNTTYFDFAFLPLNFSLLNFLGLCKPGIHCCHTLTQFSISASLIIISNNKLGQLVGLDSSWNRPGGHPAQLS